MDQANPLMSLYNGPDRWTGSLDEDGLRYNRDRWFGPAATARMETLHRLYDRQLVGGTVYPLVILIPGLTVVEFILHQDTTRHGQELRMAIQEGPWPWVDAEVRRILSVEGMDGEWRNLAGRPYGG